MDQRRGLRNIETAQAEIFRAQIQIGMEQAAEMLSRLLEPEFTFRIKLNDPQVAPQTESPEGSQQLLAGVCLEIKGAITGDLLLLFPAEKACQLAGLLLRQTPPADLDGEPLRSTLKEVGNIFASGVLSSLDDRMKLRALPSPPAFLSGTRQQIEDQCQGGCQQQEAFSVEGWLDCFSTEGTLIAGTVIFRIAEESLARIVAAGGLSGIEPLVSS